MEEIDTEDCRRSMRKRRKINYNQTVTKPKCKAEQEHELPKRKLRKRSKCQGEEKSVEVKKEPTPVAPAPSSSSSSTSSTATPPKYPSDKLDSFIQDLIATGDRAAMEKTIAALQTALGVKDSQTSPGKGRSGKAKQPELSPKPVQQQQQQQQLAPPPITPVQPVQPKPVIMEGVINNTSCYLIPINISNIAQIPQIQGNIAAPTAIPPPPQKPLVFKEYTAPRKPMIVSPAVSRSRLPPVVIPTPQQQIVVPDDPPVASVAPTSLPTSESTRSTQELILRQRQLVAGMAARSSAAAAVEEPEISLTAPHEVSVSHAEDPTPMSGPTKDLPPYPSFPPPPYSEEDPAVVSGGKSSGTGEEGTASNTTAAVGDNLIQNILETLQSTESLNEALGQLNQEEIMAIVNLLTDSTTDNPISDIGSEITKLISTTSGAGKSVEEVVSEESGIEEDLDFHHISTPEMQNGTKCVMCGLVCEDVKSFIAHTRVHTFSYRYSCYECGYGTSSMNDLLIHKSKEHVSDISKISPESLKCIQGKEEDGSTKSGLDTMVVCPDCRVELPIDLLPAHMTSLHKPFPRSTPGRKPKCTVCSAVLENKEEMGEHLKHHRQQNDLFLCFFCPQTYTTVTSLQLHTSNQHAAQACKRQHRCTECDRVFSGSYHLLRHIKTVHEQRRDYQCSKCEKSFVELHCLRRHIRNIHNHVRDHTCPVCNRGFTYRQDMFRHIMSVHQKIRDIKCPLCSEKFYHRYFIGHAARVHDLKVKYRDGICYIYDDNGNVIHKIT